MAAPGWQECFWGAAAGWGPAPSPDLAVRYPNEPLAMGCWQRACSGCDANDQIREMPHGVTGTAYPALSQGCKR